MRRKAMERQREGAQRHAGDPSLENVDELEGRLRAAQQELEVAAENDNRIIVNFSELFE